MKQLFLTLTVALFGYGSYAQTNTFPSSGNVGIGTTSPGAELDLLGTYEGGSASAVGVKIGPALQTSYVNGLNQYGVLATPAFYTYNSNVANAYGIKIAPTNVGIYTTSNAYGLSVDAPTVTSGFVTNSYAAVFNGGNVGIGTASPGYKLDIEGGSAYVDLDNLAALGGQLTISNGYGNEYGAVRLNLNNGGAVSWIKGVVTGPNTNTGSAMVFWSAC